MDLLLVVLFLLASMASAFQDVIKYRFKESVLAKIKNEKIYRWLQSDYKYHFVDNDPKTGVRKKLFWKIPVPYHIIDGWHAAKNIKILSLTTTIIISPLAITLGDWGHVGVLYLFFGLLWSAGFLLMFNHFLMQKKHRKPVFDFWMQLFK